MKKLLESNRSVWIHCKDHFYGSPLQYNTKPPHMDQLWKVNLSFTRLVTGGTNESCGLYEIKTMASFSFYIFLQKMSKRTQSIHVPCFSPCPMPHSEKNPQSCVLWGWKPEQKLLLLKYVSFSLHSILWLSHLLSEPLFEPEMRPREKGVELLSNSSLLGQVAHGYGKEKSVQSVDLGSIQDFI